MASFVIRTLGDLGEDASFAPERQHAKNLALAAGGVALGELVVLRNDRLEPADAAGAIVLDTTHAKDGLLDIAAARRASTRPKSAKKLVRTGDVLVSRLRPYLRQIALVHPAALARCGSSKLACSTEYYVLAPRHSDSLEYLIPFLLAPQAQAILAAGQEGGHHPRVPVDTLMALRVPKALVATRRQKSAAVFDALGAIYAGLARFQDVLASGRPDK